MAYDHLNSLPHYADQQNPQYFVKVHLVLGNVGASVADALCAFQLSLWWQKE